MRRRPPISVLIVDDEPLARRRIKGLLRHDREVEVVGSCDSGVEALSLVEGRAPDLIFLDIQMPGMDGFEFLRNIKLEKLPRVIFVTAHDHYALQAFEVYALDYLLKPFDDERFEKSLSRAKEHLLSPSEVNPDERLLSLLDALRSKSRKRDLVLVKAGGREFFIKAEAIDWVEAVGKYVRIHAARESYLLREGIGEMELQLNPEMFCRIHRSTIVNAGRIREMRPWFHGDYEITLLDGTRLRLSRRYRPNLRNIALNSL
jgi:two-component system LytT family response regulator